MQWLAHSDDISDPNDGCMLGYKEKLLRLRKASVCWNGRDYEVNKQPTPCSCTLDDFMWSVVQLLQLLFVNCKSMSILQLCIVRAIRIH